MLCLASVSEVFSGIEVLNIKAQTCSLNESVGAAPQDCYLVAATVKKKQKN